MLKKHLHYTMEIRTKRKPIDKTNHCKIFQFLESFELFLFDKDNNSNS